MPRKHCPLAKNLHTHDEPLAKYNFRLGPSCSSRKWSSDSCREEGASAGSPDSHSSLIAKRSGRDVDGGATEAVSCADATQRGG